MKHQKSILQDAFTKNLITIFTELIRKEALRRKKHFCDALDIVQSHWNNIETHTRSYPLDPQKRKLCAMNLYNVYGVNPDFLNEKSDVMFLREPEKAPKAITLEVVNMNFNNKREKEKVLAELGRYKSELEDAQEEIAQLREALAKYEASPRSVNNPDKNPDKK